MFNKVIKFDTFLKATQAQVSFKRDTAYTNDRKSVQVYFNIKDTDISGMGAQVLLYMRDGSFYQQTEDTGVASGSDFVKYTLKDNEGKHSGVVQTQLIVIDGDKEIASQKFEFNIKAGLDKVVATEVMITDWTTLTREAREYIEEMRANETQRQSDFDNAQADRQSVFVTHEDARQTNENNRIENEETREESEDNRFINEEGRIVNENTRIQQEEARVDAESLRMEQFREMQVTQNLDDGKSYKTTLEIKDGMPRLKLEEVTNG